MSNAMQRCFRGGSDSPTTSSSSSHYQTALGLATLTWSTEFIGRSLNANLFLDTNRHNNPSLHLHLKPWNFFSKKGSKSFQLSNLRTTHALPTTPEHEHHQVSIEERHCGLPNHHSPAQPLTITFFWDFSHAHFSSGPEPSSGFYFSIVAAGQMLLLVGDSINPAYLKTKAQNSPTLPSLLLRHEHIFASKAYSTHVRIAGKNHEVSVNCTKSKSGDPRLSFSIDRKKILLVKRLRWKFRGNERVNFDGIPIQVSWDVYNWLFDDVADGYAVFMFKFQSKDMEDGDCVAVGGECRPKRMILWHPFGLGSKDFSRMKMKKSLLKTRSFSSSSSASSAGSSSVMEWSSMEEAELQSSIGFSLLIYAWNRKN